MKLFGYFRNIALMALVSIFVLTSAVSFAFWYVGPIPKYVELDVSFGAVDSGVSRLPKPQDLPEGDARDILSDVLDKLGEISDSAVLDQLLDALVPIIEDIIISEGLNTENSAGFNGVMVGETIEDIFSDPDYQNIWGSAQGYFLVYTEMVDGNPEYRVIYVNPNSSFNLMGNANSLDEALRFHWTGINLISQEYNPANTYTIWTAPISDEEGRRYLLWNGGYSGNHPSVNGAWFEITHGYTFLQSNINAYYENRIVNHLGYWYIARSSAWQAPTVNPQPWEPWMRVELWEEGSYNAGEVVRTMENRFFRALQTTTQQPNEQSTRNGHWQEINNGWIGIGLGNIIRSHYLAHNTYRQNDIVIYGINSRHNYKYFRALKDVPSDQRPVVRNLMDIPSVNSEYWQLINN